ncbi:uncharacterized protein LOC103035591 [Astyanax mexicanus]|uniref:uncharacterized protein LOC103035591 n=1 Tax=Astyanax mexicanus TaxID=7994 RepID=UPI0020CABE12|nr:uncharacterized protein LOC103035591 [Astyanax mexicanus]
MILLGNRLRVCLLCSVLVLAVKCCGGTKDDCQVSPEDKPPLGIRDVSPVPQSEAFFQKGSYLKPKLIDFASIYHTHKARWSSSLIGSAETRNTVYKEAMNQINQPSTANFNITKAEVFGVKQDRKTLTLPFEGFAMTPGQFSPSEVGQISKVSVSPLQAELSTPPLLQSEPSMLSNANILLQHTVMDSRSPKNYKLQQNNHVYSQIEPSPHTYTTEDYSKEAQIDFQGFARAQEDTGVSGAANVGYAHSTLRFLKPQTKPVTQDSRSTDDLSKSEPSASTSETTEDIKPAASHFRSQQAWEASAHRQQSGKIQHGSGPLPLPKYSGMSHTTTHPGKWKKPGLSMNVQLNTLSSNQATRSLNHSATGKFKPFQIKGP